MIDEVQKAEQLTQLSNEIEKLIDRVADDVREQRGAEEERRASGFVIYLLRNTENAPFQTLLLKKVGIATNDIAQTPGFSALRDYCEGLSLQARVEDAIRPSREYINPCLGIIVDGWP
ncbi:hypothetical protein [Nisaea nitritireducens]|uniref:hypothetical protein n=1 Tax=Nisaea nitritireducens TaxID=568392 RepID=UPI001865B1A3|nr:hypothetical protein [Nisaea nitritireducens]